MVLLVALLSIFLHQGAPHQEPAAAALVPLPRYGEQAAWSPDSSEIAVPAPHSITVLDRSGQVKAKLAGAGALEPFTESCFAPLSWSRSGSRLLFVGPDPDHAERCVVGELGIGGQGASSTRRLGAVTGADWSARGWPLAFVRDARAAAGDRSSLWMLARLGGRPRRIVAGRGELSEPTVAADGSEIAYIARARGQAWGSIWEAGKGGRREVAANLLVSWMDWSPDHRRLAVIGVPRFGPRRNQLLLLGPGRKRRVLVGHEVAAGAASWSPDGEALAYATESGEIRSLDLRSGRSEDVAQLNGRIATSLLWAPDGGALAFTAQPSGGPD